MQWFIKALRQYADFKGRAQRAEYWYFSLFNILIILAAMVLDHLLGTQSRHADGTGLLTFLSMIGLFLPGLAVSVRRLHDVSRSAWWLLINAVPLEIGRAHV